MATDVGLPRIARLLGQEEAFAKFLEAAAMEEAGDFKGAIESYKRAFKMWGALDSVVDDGGLPVAVRREAEAAGIDCGPSSAKLDMDSQESPRFDVDSPEEWLAYLRENGYCVLAGVADTEAVARAKSLLWDFLESIPGSQATRADSETWGSGWIPNPVNGIIGVHGFGQSEFCWHARSLPKARQAFESVWDCKDVIASFDGGNAFRPWVHKPEWKTSGGWWHVDQNSFLPGQDGLKCVQGLLTFTDATPAAGGLCVIPGSHKHHGEVCRRACAHILSGHFVQVQPGDPVLESGARLVCAKAGDLILWDSRCVHCNTPGLQNAETDIDVGLASESELLRVVAYICMTPASWASPEVLAQRKQGYSDNETTDHVPHEWHGIGQALPWPPPKSWKDASFLRKRLIVGASQAALSQAQPQDSEGVCNDPATAMISPLVAKASKSSLEESSVVAETHFHDIQSLEGLNAYLMHNSYLASAVHVTKEDFDRCQAIQDWAVDTKAMPHLARWYTHIRHLMGSLMHVDENWVAAPDSPT